MVLFLHRSFSLSQSQPFPTSFKLLIPLPASLHSYFILSPQFPTSSPLHSSLTLLSCCLSSFFHLISSSFPYTLEPLFFLRCSVSLPSSSFLLSPYLSHSSPGSSPLSYPPSPLPLSPSPPHFLISLSVPLQMKCRGGDCSLNRLT